jgi:ketosteroid isomerase-like protein
MATPGTTFSAATIGDRVRRALESADLDQMAALLSPDVQWGAPGDAKPDCRNRRQVLSWYSRGRAAGTRATVTELTVHGDALLVGLLVAWADGPAERWQVLTVGPDGIRDIRGFEDRPEACSYLGE